MQGRIKAMEREILGEIALMDDPEKMAGLVKSLSQMQGRVLRKIVTLQKRLTYRRRRLAKGFKRPRTAS